MCLHVSLLLPSGDEPRFEVSCGARWMESMMQLDIDTEMGYGYIHCGNPFQWYRTAPWYRRNQQPIVSDVQNRRAIHRTVVFLHNLPVDERDEALVHSGLV